MKIEKVAEVFENVHKNKYERDKNGKWWLVCNSSRTTTTFAEELEAAYQKLKEAEPNV